MHFEGKEGRYITRKNNIFWIIYATITGIFGITSIATCFLVEENNKILGYLSPILCAIAIIIGVVYLFKGYGKGDSKIYKAFLFAYGIVLLFRAPACCLIYPLRPYIAMGGVLNSAGALGIVAVLFFAKDLGRKLSMRMALYSMTMTYLFMIIVMIVCPGFLRGGDMATLAYNVSNGRQAVLATVLYVAVRSKYIDKAERGTK